MGVRKGWGENEEKKNRAFIVISFGHICCLCIYPVGTDRNIGGLWVGKVMDNWEENFIQFLYFPCYSMKC